MTRKLMYVSIGAVLFVAMIFASFFDLQISQSLYNPDSLFGQFFAYIGELPMYLLIPISLSIIAVFLYKKRTKKNVAFACVFALFSLATFWLCVSKFLDFALPLPIQILVAIVLFCASWFLFLRFEVDTLGRLYRWAILALIVCLLSLVITQIIKNLWGRIRFRDLTSAGSFDDFTPWYLPVGITGNKSFPSGHSVAVTMIVLILPLLESFGVQKRTEVIVGIIVTITIVAVTTSRIVVGAHFLSDVTMGVIVGVAVFGLVQYYISNHYRNQTETLDNES